MNDSILDPKVIEMYDIVSNQIEIRIRKPATIRMAKDEQFRIDNDSPTVIYIKNKNAIVGLWRDDSIMHIILI